MKERIVGTYVRQRERKEMADEHDRGREVYKERGWSRGRDIILNHL